MSATVDYPAQYGGGIPHRKPLPTGTTYTGHSVTGNDQLFTRQPAHSHSRSASSTVLPGAAPSPYLIMNQQSFSQPVPPQQQQQPPTQPYTRRTLSNATSSTSSSNANLARAPTNTSSYASSIRRSTSSRSNTPTSYVALMRKQKATVWCDRAQHEDPRLLAQQRAAKMRATMEVVGGNNAVRTSTGSSGGLAGGVRSKIRHHGAVKASAYTAANLSGAGVPMRLSASEVDESESEDEKEGGSSYNRYHQRNGSGRSSLNSGHRGVSYMAPTAPPPQIQLQHSQPSTSSNGSTPSSGASYSPADDAALRRQTLDPEETPHPDMYTNQSDYFGQPGGNGTSVGSGSSGEEAKFGDIGGLPYRQGGQNVEKTMKTNDDLRRRGSVDDRTMTMSAGRLFVANPDLSD